MLLKGYTFVHRRIILLLRREAFRLSDEMNGVLVPLSPLSARSITATGFVALTNCFGPLSRVINCKKCDLKIIAAKVIPHVLASLHIEATVSMSSHLSDCA